MKVVVDSEGNQVKVGAEITMYGVPYRLMGINPPVDGNPGYIILFDTTTETTFVAYPPKIGCIWGEGEDVATNSSIVSTIKDKNKAVRKFKRR